MYSFSFSCIFLLEVALPLLARCLPEADFNNGYWVYKRLPGQNCPLLVEGSQQLMYLHGCSQWCRFSDTAAFWSWRVTLEFTLRCVPHGPTEAVVAPNVNVAALNVSVCIFTVTGGVGDPCTRPFCAVLVLFDAHYLPCESVVFTTLNWKTWADFFSKIYTCDVCVHCDHVVVQGLTLEGLIPTEGALFTLKIYGNYFWFISFGVFLILKKWSQSICCKIQELPSCAAGVTSRLCSSD